MYLISNFKLHESKIDRIKGRVVNSTIINGDFNTLLPSIDRILDKY